MFAVLMTAVVGCATATKPPAAPTDTVVKTEEAAPAPTEERALTEEPDPTETPEEAVEPTESPTKAPAAPTGGSTAESACVDCHSDQQKLIDTAKPEEPVESENEGAG